MDGPDMRAVPQEDAGHGWRPVAGVAHLPAEHKNSALPTRCQKNGSH